MRQDHAGPGQAGGHDGVGEGDGGGQLDQSDVITVREKTLTSTAKYGHVFPTGNLLSALQDSRRILKSNFFFFER